MFKLLIIGLKDLKLTFRDRAAVIFMLLAPFLLTLGMGLVTGRFSGTTTTGISDIPVILINQDDGQLSTALVDLFYSQELADLVEPSLSTDPQAARQQVDEDKATAAILIPQGFTRSIIPTAKDFDNETNLLNDPIKIELYANPTRPTSVGVIKAILDEFISQVDEGSISGQVVILQMLTSGRITPQQAQSAGETMGERLQNAPKSEETAIHLKIATPQGKPVEFDILAYLAPGMALMFLMYTVSYGGRSILAERAQGTLPRLLISPTHTTQILGGKVLGIFLTGIAQMFILIGGTSLLFQLQWGDPLGVIVLVLAAVFGATGWGMLITAFARTPAQVGSIGSALMLIFGILGGSFIQLDQMPASVQMISRITPNAWALDGFTTLALGGSFTALTAPLMALLSMGSILFLVSVLLFGRKNLVQK